MRKGIIAAAVLLVVVIGAGGGWWVYRHLLRNPVEAAKSLLAAGDVRGAQLELRNAVRKDPNNAEAHFQLGSLQLQFGDAVAAEKELNAARATGYKGPGLFPQLARSYLAQQKFAQLLKDLSPAALPPPDAAALLVSRSLAQIALGDPVAARGSATTAERLAPTLAEAPLAMARIAATTGDRAQALLKIEDALKINPKLIEALGLKADLLRVTGDVAQAMAALDTAVAAAPYLSRVRLARARALLVAGEDTKAKQDVEAALKIEPKNTFGLYLQALLLVRAKDWTNADIALQKIQPVMGQLPRGEYYYALAKTNIGQLEQAAETIGHYLGRNKADPDGYRLLAQIKLKLGQSGEANAALKRASELAGDLAPPPPGMGVPAPTDDALARSPEALTRLAAQQLSAGDTSGAERDLQQSLETIPTRADSGAQQVLALLELGDVQQARAALDKLERQPTARPEVIGNLTAMIKVAELDFDGARQAWEATIKADPTAVPARVNYARIIAIQGRADEAEKMLGDILAAEPANRPALRAMLEILLANERVEQAAGLVRAARKAAPGTLGLLVTEAALHARANNFTAAYATLDEVSLEEALSPLLLTTRAQLRIAQGQPQDAADAFRQILIANPSDAVTRRRLVDILLALGKTADAEKVAQDGLALAPGNSEFLQIVTLLVYRAKGLEAALAKVDALLQDPVNLPTARLLKGGLYMTAQKYPEAVAAFEAEMRAMPFTALLTSLASALRAAGQPEEAVRALREWVAKQPDPAVSESLAGLELEAKRYDAAEQDLLAVLAARPNDAAAMNNLAWIYARRGDPRAEAMARRAYLLAPSPQAADTLGWILVQKGDAQTGASLMRRAIQGITDDPVVAYHTAVALRDTGARAEAARLIASVLAQGGAFEDRAAAEKLAAELGPPPPPPPAPAATPAAATPAATPAPAAPAKAPPAKPAAGKPPAK